MKYHGHAAARKQSRSSFLRFIAFLCTATTCNLFWAGGVDAQQPAVHGLSDLSAIDDLIDESIAGTNPRIRETRVPTQGSDELVLLRQNGIPVLVYARGRHSYNLRRTSFAMTCRGSGELDLHVVLLGVSGVPSRSEYALRIGSLGSETIEIPVSIKKRLDRDVLVRGILPANLRTIGSLVEGKDLFFMQLVRDGRPVQGSSGISLPDYDTTMLPVVQECAATADPDAIAAEESRHRVEEAAQAFQDGIEEMFGPSEEKVRDAIQRHLDQQLALVNPSAEYCSTIRERNDLVGAILCLRAGGGELTGNTASIRVHSVSIERCVELESGAYVCRYGTEAEMQGSGSIMGNVAKLFNAATGSGATTHASFVKTGDQWNLVQTYSSCAMDGPQITCR